METQQKNYLEELIKCKNNGLVKVISGIRYSRKTFLLNPIFKDYLLNNNISEDHIIFVDFDLKENYKLRDEDKFNEFVRSKIYDNRMYYLFLSEVQFLNNYELVIYSLNQMENIDIYATISSFDFQNEDFSNLFFGKINIIKTYPLSYKNYKELCEIEDKDVFNEYFKLGGMPRLLRFINEDDKKTYMSSLIANNFLADLYNLFGCKQSGLMKEFMETIALYTGKLTNINMLYNEYKDTNHKILSKNTLDSYLNALINSFIIGKATRYDIKRRKTISTPSKYYYLDHGIRNNLLNYQNMLEKDVLENIVYVELLRKGYDVYNGVLETQIGGSRNYLEVNFVGIKNNEKIYVQLNVDDTIDKQEYPLSLIQDGFRKIIITKENNKPYYTENGIYVVSLNDFLMNDNI